MLKNIGDEAILYAIFCFFPQILRQTLGDFWERQCLNIYKDEKLNFFKFFFVNFKYSRLPNKRGVVRIMGESK